MGGDVSGEDVVFPAAVIIEPLPQRVVGGLVLRPRDVQPFADALTMPFGLWEVVGVDVVIAVRMREVVGVDVVFSVALCPD